MNKFLLLILFFGLNLRMLKRFKKRLQGKYHMSSCRMVKNVSSGVSLSKTIELDYLLVKFVNLQFHLYHLVSKPKKVNGVNSKNQCKGITKRKKKM